MVLAAPVRFVWAVSALTNLVQPLTRVVFAPQAIPVWPVRAYQVLVPPRRRPVLVREATRGVFVLKACAATMCAVSSFQPDHAMVERFAKQPLEHLPASFQLAVLNTLVALALVLQLHI